ncbi:DUF4202 domain-containing protein [Shimia sp. R11_0]|uniref:DUF4202 domain-containing protein n=1 Tax=Shimia sp. R11_0 TaxID=2821096 RepID=UPI001ADC8DFC|nr:DUF4202 domain-containing protein [Shimia sp. R11_0]MBO9478498.1 DUF4202 domain-containing protein [Shimia sp. R11_0]
MTRLQSVLDAIDTANAKDPNIEDGQPEALLYGSRMTQEANRLFPEASEALQIAARGQHIERWVLKRADFPEGRAGYLKWRRELGIHHANRVSDLMSEAGYDEEDIVAAGTMLRKEGLKRNAEVQALEDIICFVFLKWYFAPFAAKHPEEKVLDIVVKTARKMSDAGRARVLAEFDLPAALAAAFQEPAA